MVSKEGPVIQEVHKYNKINFHPYLLHEQYLSKRSDLKLNPLVNYFS